MSFERILIIRPSALGDVCRSVPVLTSLRRAFPNARIDWLVQTEFADAVRAHPDLSNVVPFARRDLSLSRLHQPGMRRRMLELVRSVREPGYDLVVDCQGLARSGLLTRLTRAKERVGHADAREMAWAAYTKRVPPGPSQHTVDRMLDLVRAVGVEPVMDMRLYAPSDAASGLPEDLLESSPIVIAPTSRWPGKRWPIERFAEIARWLLAHSDRPIAIVGAGSEREQCGPLLEVAANHPRGIDLIGATSIGGLMQLISKSSLVIANDSAALHMAVGYDKPIVALFGPTDTAKVGPYRRDECVLQHAGSLDGISHKDDDAGLQLMQRITPEEVIERLESLLGSAAPVISEEQT
ncbi:MAG: glycosyltransferase family 9 protein [Phycisphaerales bacterium JB065]